MSANEAASPNTGQVYYVEEGIKPMPVIVNTVDHSTGQAFITDAWGRFHQVPIANLMTTPGVQPVRERRRQVAKPSQVAQPPSNAVDAMLSKLQHGGHPVTPDEQPEDDDPFAPSYPGQGAGAAMPPIVPHEEPISHEAGAPVMNKGVQIYNLNTKMWEDGYILRAVDEQPPGRAMVEFGGKRQWIPMKRVRKPTQGTRRVQRVPIREATVEEIADELDAAGAPALDGIDRDKWLAVQSLLKQLNIDEALRRLKAEPKELPAITMLERGLANLKRKTEAKQQPPVKLERSLAELRDEFAIHAPEAPDWFQPDLEPRQTVPAWANLPESVRGIGQYWWTEGESDEWVAKKIADAGVRISAPDLTALRAFMHQAREAKAENVRIDMNNKIAKLCQWRWYFADLMLEGAALYRGVPPIVVRAVNASGKDIPAGTAVCVVGDKEAQLRELLKKWERHADAVASQLSGMYESDSHAAQSGTMINLEAIRDSYRDVSRELREKLNLPEEDDSTPLEPKPKVVFANEAGESFVEGEEVERILGEGTPSDPVRAEAGWYLWMYLGNVEVRNGKGVAANVRDPDVYFRKKHNADYRTDGDGNRLPEKRVYRVGMSGGGGKTKAAEGEQDRTDTMRRANAPPTPEAVEKLKKVVAEFHGGEQDQSKPCPHCGAEITLDAVGCGYGTRCYAARLQAGMDEGDCE